jgi:2-keto-myo-inositol isomerase
MDLAAELGCTGIELRNDLADKQLTDRPFFDGEDPAAVGAYALGRGLRLLGLSEAYGFNDWSDSMQRKVATLIAQARQCGAESISLIPGNAGDHGNDVDRARKLETALHAILPMLEEAGMVALIEPLGFVSSSLRRKSEAIAAIEAVGGTGRFKLVHDTFHHHLAAEKEFFAGHTGIVHISGVIDPQLSRDAMGDEHRLLVDASDRLGNVEQISRLLQLGYKGCFSFEAFSPEVHAYVDPANDLARSMAYIREAQAELLADAPESA